MISSHRSEPSAHGGNLLLQATGKDARVSITQQHQDASRFFSCAIRHPFVRPVAALAYAIMGEKVLALETRRAIIIGCTALPAPSGG